ncbi:MAG: PAS domain S-box protein [Ignavibacteria bacterium]|nr:PAS domain S-box protein [Ignavibacteria bacterium]
MKSKFIIVLTISILTITTLLLLGLHNSTKQEVIQRFQSRQLATAHQLSKDIETYLRDESRAVASLSTLPVIKNKKTDLAGNTVHKYFESLKIDHIKSISIYDEKGTIIYSTLKDVVSLDQSDTKFFEWAAQRKNKGKQFITAEVPLTFIKSSKDSTFQVMIVAPIYGEFNPTVPSSINPPRREFSDKFNGIVAITVNLDEILTSFFLTDTTNIRKENAWLLDKDGTVLYQNEHPEMILFNVHQRDESCNECHESFEYIEKINAKSSGSTEYQLKEREKKLSSFVTLNFQNISWKVVVNTPLDEVTNFVDKNSLQTLAIILVFSIILFTGSYSLLRINKMKAKAENEAEKLRGQHAINLILKSAGEGIFGLDLDGNHTFVNPRAAELLGYTAEELIGKHSHSLWHHTHPNGEPYEGKDCHIYETLRRGTSHAGEEYFWCKDGTGFPVNFSTTPMLEGTKVVGAVVTFRDITETKRAELEHKIIYEINHGVTTTANLDELLKLIHESLKRVLYAENIFIALHDPITGLFNFPYFVDKFDPTPEPVAIGKSCTALVFDTGKPLLLTQDLFDLLVSRNEVELVGTNSPSWVGVPLKTPSKTIGVLVLQHYEEENIYTERDVKFLESVGSQIAIVIERKQAEITLSNERMLLRTIIDLIPDAIYVKDINGRKTLANPKEVLLSGLSSEKDVLGKTDIELFPERKEHGSEDEDQSVLQEGKSILDIEGELVDKNGEVRWLLGLKVPLRNAEGQIIGIVGLNHDITERKRAEEEIIKSNKQLSKTVAEKDKFFSIIAHDLRSPFSGFINLTQMMAEESESFSKDELTDFSKSMYDSASTVYKLLENLLEWAQMQKGTITFEPSEISLSDVVAFSLTTILQRAVQKGITIVNEVPENLRVYADEKMINTVLRNFLSNAVKFTKRDGKIIIRSKKIENDMVEVSVQDTGVGMLEKDVKRLFKMEEKVSSKGTDDEPSTGLGLLLCKEFVEKNGGKVWAESVKGEGSTFYFTVPASSDKSADNNL